MTNLSARAKILVEMAGSVTNLAKIAGISPPSISDWVNGKTKSIKGSPAARIARHFNINPLWVSDGVGLMRSTMINHEIQPEPPNTSPGPDLAGRVPLISWVRAGAWSEIIDNLAPGDAEEWLPCPVAHGRHTFALVVRGESMHNPHGRPSFQDGDLIFVDPEREARHGSLVVVRLDDQGEATFKRLIVEGERSFLKALNPAWPEPMLEINGNATVCGVVIFKGEVL